MEFNRRILASILMIALLSVFVGAGTMAFFSDTEKLTHGSDVLTMGILDISLDKTTIVPVLNMMPCETSTTSFVVQNTVSTVPVKVFVRIADITTSGGVFTDPEKKEDSNDAHNYLPPWIIYDLRTVDDTWYVNEDQDIRLDNVQNVWVYVGQIADDGSKTIECSFHLRSWKDSPMEITNWAQGDTVSFNIEVYATQLTAPAPEVTELKLYPKNAWWEVQGGAVGTLDIKAGTFKTEGLVAGDYELIYYADPWPGTGGKSLGTGSPTGGVLTISGIDLSGIPAVGDKNYPVGGKIWLVLDDDYVGGKMIAWNPSSYLFEEHLIKVP